MLDGFANVEEFTTDFAGGFVGMAVRVFDPETRLWAIYWADSRTPGLLEAPMIGSFSDGVGIFECEELFEGRPITVRFTWSDITETSAALGAVVLGGRRRDVGDELDDPAHAGLAGGGGLDRGVSEVLVDEGDRHASFADRRGDTFHLAEANVAAGENARHARLEQVRVAVELPAPGRAHVGAGQDVAMPVQRDLGRQPRCLCVGADEDEEAARSEPRRRSARPVETSIASSDTSPCTAAISARKIVAMFDLVASWSIR